MKFEELYYNLFKMYRICLLSISAGFSQKIITPLTDVSHEQSTTH